MDHRLVKSSGLIRAKDLAHGEDMAERFLLQFTHCLMRPIDGCGDPWTITMFGFDCIGKPRIVSSQFKLQCLAAHGKTLLEKIDLAFLPVIEIELAMQNVMQLDTGGGRLREEMASKPHTGDSRDERDKRDQENQPRFHRGPASKVDGASGLEGPKGDKVADASAGGVKPVLATPNSTAAKAAVMPTLSCAAIETCGRAASRLKTASSNPASPG